MAPITVVMSVYNGLPFLPEAVDSILRQSFGDINLLIVDDGSTDGGEHYLDRLKDPRVRVVHQPNRGQGAARNVGLAMCDSEFVAIMDSDDVAVSSRLESQLDFLRRHKDVGMLGTQFAYLGVGGRAGFSPPMPCDHAEIHRDLLLGRLAVCQPSLMCRTSVLKGIGGYRIAGSGEDWDMFLRMGEASKLANLGEVLHLYRVHPGSVTTKYVGLVRARIAHACCCAKQRAGGSPEVTFDEFVAKERARAPWQRAAERMDWYASAQYRAGLAQILDSRTAKGYVRLAWAAVCSPPRTWQRLCRASRKLLQRVTGAWRPTREEVHRRAQLLDVNRNRPRAIHKRRAA